MAINGIVGILGGVVNVEVSKTFQLTPAVVINNTLTYDTPPSDFTYESSDTTAATVSANGGLITASATANQTCDVTITYTDENGNTYEDIIDVFVRPQGWFPPEPEPEPTDWAQPENILKDKIAVGEDGEEMTGTAAIYVDGTTLYMPEGLLTPGN